MDDINLNPSGADGVSNLFSTITPSIVTRPRVSDAAGADADTDGEISEFGDDDTEASYQTQEPMSSDEDESTPVPDLEEPDVVGTKRRAIEAVIEKTKHDLERVMEIRTRLQSSSAFDEQDLKHVDGYCDILREKLQAKESELDMFGDKMKCCEEMENKIKSRLRILRDCESLVDFRRHKEFAMFFAQKHVRLNRLLEKMSEI